MFSLGLMPTHHITKQWAVYSSLPYLLHGTDHCRNSRSLSSRRANMNLYLRKIFLAGNVITIFRTCLNWSHICKKNSINYPIKRRQRQKERGNVLMMSYKHLPPKRHWIMTIHSRIHWPVRASRSEDPTVIPELHSCVQSSELVSFPHHWLEILCTRCFP